MTGQYRTLAQLLSEQIMADIRAQGYKPGDRLPTEKALCEQLGAGRNTVREALKLLASRNVVEIRHGSGTFVSDKQGVADDPLGFALVADQEQLTRDLLQVRCMIEPPIAALAAQYATQEEIDKLEAILLEMERVMEARGDYAELDMRFHAQIAECTHNIVMETLIPVITRGVLVFAKTVRDTEYQQTRHAHRRIFEFIRARRAVEAQTEMHFHLLYNSKRYTGQIDGMN